jgi:hypothetical protein
MAHTTAGASAADAAVAAVGLRKVYGGVIDRPSAVPTATRRSLASPADATLR